MAQTVKGLIGITGYEFENWVDKRLHFLLFDLKESVFASNLEDKLLAQDTLYEALLKDLTSFIDSFSHEVGSWVYVHLVHRRLIVLCLLTADLIFCLNTMSHM